MGFATSSLSLPVPLDPLSICQSQREKLINSLEQCFMATEMFFCFVYGFQSVSTLRATYFIFIPKCFAREPYDIHVFRN